MTKTSEVMDMIYGVINGNEKLPVAEEKLEALDNECFEIISKSEAEIVKPELERLENMDIFEHDFTVFKKLTKTWSAIYAVQNKYYAIRTIE